METKNTDSKNKGSFGTQKLDDERRVRVLSPGMLVFKRFVRNKLAITGLIILVVMFAFSFLGGIVSPYTQSQVFKHDEEIMQEYATCMMSTDFRYTVRQGAEFPEAARATAVLAISKGEASFTYGDKTYSLVKEGEDFYTFGDALMIAKTRTLAGKFSISAEESTGFTVSPEFAAAAETAVAARAGQFEADGTIYTLVNEGKISSIYHVESIAMASKRVFDPYEESQTALTAGFPFRYAVESARVKGASSFTLDGATYVISGDANDLIVSQEEGGTTTPVCSVSDILVSPNANDVFLKGDFKSVIRDTIRAKQTQFIYADEAGKEVNYRIDRVNTTYTVRTLEESRVITMFEFPSQEHLLGTDSNGMDVMTRLMYGGRISLMVGFVVVILETLIGVVLGGISGYFGGWVDTAIMRFVDLFNCIPFYPIVMIIGTVMDKMEIDPIKRIFILMAVLGILGWTSIARVVRGQILSLREQDFMVATEATGIRVSRRIFKHLVPNVMPLLIVQATMSLGGIIITEATLSFLGLGVKYPLASWGSIINAATNVHVMTNYWFIWIPAGLLIVLTVLGFNFVGDGLRDAFDPKMKR
ncbi:MAG TPA: ABC transporter permease [Clostridia bacterium]|nr:ABC transporter permease [Clostridia bacterium]